MYQPFTSRYARFGADGEFEALVADGLPDWPADGNPSSLSDEDLGALHDAYMAQRQEMIDGGEDAIDETWANQLIDRITALRTEAAARYAAAEAAAAAAGEGEGAGDPPPAGEGEGGDPPPAGDPAGTLARLQALEGDPTPTPDPAPAGNGVVVQIDTAALAQATGAVVQGLLPELVGAVADRVRVPAEPRRPMTARDLAPYRPDEFAPDESGQGRTRNGRLVHTGDVPGLKPGDNFDTVESLVQAFVRRHRDLGQSVGDDEKVLVASYRNEDLPARRNLKGLDGYELKKRIREVCGPEAMGVDPWNLQRELPIGKGGMIVDDVDNLVASGGLAAPVEPYYPQLVLARADRPVMDAMPTFVADRGGIKLTMPPKLGDLTAATTTGSFGDGVTNTDTSFVSATAAFVASDVGQPLIETDTKGVIPSGTYIVSVTNGTTVVLNQATTGTTTAVAFRLPARNPNNLGAPVGLVSAAQDAAGPPNTVKFTYDVPIGTQREYDVYSIYTSLQFSNLTARTFPEQVEANILLANAVAARVAEQQSLDVMTAYSTLFTGAKTFGTARQLLAQLEHEAAYYRNHNRMDPAVVLRVLLPAWALNAMRGDYIASFIGGDANWGLSDDELFSWLADRHLLVNWYWDGPSDVSQLFASPGSGAINTGANTATPIAIPDYPGTGSTTNFRTKVVSYMWAEGNWLGLTTGELNLGLVRDSILNSQNRFRNFEETWETPAFVGVETLRAVHTVASDGSYGAAVSVTLGAGSGL